MKTHPYLSLPVAAAVVFAATTASAQPATDVAAPRTMAEFLTLARAHNATVATAYAGVRASRERVGIAKGYPDPSLLYGYTFEAEDAVHAPSAKGRHEFTLLQPIPFFGKRGMRGETAAAAATMNERMADAMAFDVDLEVKVAFYEYVRVAEIARVLDEEAALLSRMREATRARYSADRAEQQDVLKLDLAVSQLEDRKTMNRRDTSTLRTRLNELTGRDPQAPLPAPEWSVPDAAPYVDTLLTAETVARRPEIAAARAQIAMAESSRRLASREYFPDLMLGVKWEFGGEADPLGNEMGDEWMAMVGIDLPIFLGKRRAMAREADAMQVAATERLRAEELRARRELEDAVQRVSAAQERRERFEELILPQAEQTFRSSEAGYRAGRVDFIDYLDSERMLLAMRREYVDVIADLGIQIAALERAIAAVPAE